MFVYINIVSGISSIHTVHYTLHSMHNRENLEMYHTLKKEIKMECKLTLR